jgi:hypothetical protein
MAKRIRTHKTKEAAIKAAKAKGYKVVWQLKDGTGWRTAKDRANAPYTWARTVEDV